MNFWAPLLIAGATIVASGYIGTAEARGNGCRVNGFNGYNGCRVSGFRTFDGCRVRGFRTFDGCRVRGFRVFNGDAGVHWRRVPVYGWHTRVVPVANGFNGFNGTYGFRRCNGFNGFRTFDGYNGFNGYYRTGFFD
jgi:hypothetical protein